MSGHKIIEALEQAAAGDLTTHVWVRDGVDKATAWDAVIKAREQEREACARIAEMPSTGRGITIADAIRARGTVERKSET
jgi:hypothetical protein